MAKASVLVIDDEQSFLDVITNKLKELVQRGEITHSIGVNAIFHLFLELQSTDS